MYRWIEDNATAISAIAAAASALFTALYFIYTIRILEQARRVADLADKAASAAKASADVGAENLRLVLRRILEEILALQMYRSCPEMNSSRYPQISRNLQKYRTRDGSQPTTRTLSPTVSFAVDRH